jgi:pyruvate/2-oxoglutarate/acetoin dehydrogenase E1 component
MAAPGVHFEITVDGIVRTHREVRATAIEAARHLQQPGARITVTDLRSVVPHDRSV